jgi:hypothetical protein
VKTIYVLRVNDANNQSKNGFQYPRKGKVSAPDWNPSPECGGGLHGWESGEGDPSVATVHPDGVWLVLKVEDSPENLVRLDGKVKFREGTVVFAGSRNAATEYIYDKTKAPKVLWVNITGGSRSTLTGGRDSTLTGGDNSTLTGGDDSTLTGGYRSTLTGGHRSTLTGGDRSTLTGGDGSTLAGGNDSTLTWKVWDGQRYRLHTFYTGEAGVEADKPYRFTDGKIEEVTP